MIDATGRVTEYEYDAAGNLLAVRNDGSVTASPPVISGTTPTGLRKGELVEVTVTGNHFTGARLSWDDSSLEVGAVGVSTTQIQFSVSAGDATETGSKSFEVSNSAGSASFSLLLSPELPRPRFNPQPIAMPPDDAARTFTLLLSNADTIEHTVALSVDNTAVATVTPSSVTFGVGQTSATIQITGHLAGLTTIRGASATLGDVSAPVFVTADFTGLRTAYANHVGVILEAPPGSQTLPIEDLSTPIVGVTVGAHIRSIAPGVLIRGQTTALVVTGAELQGVTGLQLSAPAGVSVTNVVASPDGTQVTADVAVTADAEISTRRVMLAGSGAPYRPSSPLGDRVLVADGLPIIESIEPFQAAVASGPATLRIRGRNMQGAQQLLISPSSRVVIAGTFTVSTDGTEIVAGIELPFDAVPGAYPIQVVTPAGQSDSTATPANTFRVVNEIQQIYTPVLAPIVGVVNGIPDIVTPELSGPLFTLPVGITMGASIHSMTPRVGIVGQTVTLTLAGTELDLVDSITANPATGLTIGSPVVAADGRSLTVEIAIAGDAPRQLRRLRVLAGTVEIPFSHPELGRFLVTEPLPELTSVAPQVLNRGGPTLTFTVRGYNLQAASAVRFLPGDGITVGTNLVVNADGTNATVSITVDGAAPTGTRVVVIDTPAGSSADVAAPANTVTIAQTTGSTYADITAPLVGVVNGTATVPTVSINGPFLSPPVGVTLEFEPEPVTAEYEFTSVPVRVALGAAAFGVSQTPLVAGGTGTLTITGYGLQEVTAVAAMPASGVTFGIPVVNGDGSQVTVPVTVDAGAAPSSYQLRLLAGATPVTWSHDATRAFFVAAAPPQIDSIDPILALQGEQITLIVRGMNFQFASAVLVEPAAGVDVLSAPSVNAGGTELTVTVRIAPDAPLGARVIRVVAPGGTTGSTAVPANTFTVYSQ